MGNDLVVMSFMLCGICFFIINFMKVMKGKKSREYEMIGRSWGYVCVVKWEVTGGMRTKGC